MSADIRPAMPMPLPRVVAFRSRRERLLRVVATTLAALCALVAVMAITAVTLSLGLT
jgi:predicted exporter